MKLAKFYQEVTDEVVRQLEAGVPPWTKPWRDSKLSGVGMVPSNLVTGRLYSGSNVLLLWMNSVAKGYPHLQYCTYNQVNDVGAKVRKGEKAAHVIFTKHVMNKDEATGDEKPSTIVKTYPVFNVAQLENLDPKYLEPQRPQDTKSGHVKANQVAAASGVPITHKGNKAFYSTATDAVTLPPYDSFTDEAAYWGVAFHELTHATGAGHRLNRRFGKRFGDMEYAAEELIAELGSAFMCARLDFSPSFRSAAYIESWLKVLKADNRAIFGAASHAGQASDWLWNKAFPDVEREAA
jgi:antirestriction protein ArdC